jgi:4-amino-4-deoxy-L-arabinose transferase-like glycosyltransferase
MAAPPELAPAPEPRLARIGPALAALATFLLHAACWGRYGLFRDELYFMVCGERLSAGYVDQPPGVAWVAGAAHALFGTWVPGFRLFGWLATAATTYLAGRLAARLSGSGVAATLASVATVACLVLAGTSHFLSMNAFEPLLILCLVHVLLRLARGEDPRLWVVAGGLAGLAVMFKYSAAPLSLALILAFLVTPARRALWTPWAAAGALFGLLVVLPNFVWQASHGFPFVELVRNGVLHKNAPTSPLRFLGGVLFEANPGNAPIWLGGLAWLLVARGARDARFAGVGALVQLLLLTFGHGKAYYVISLMPILLAAGGVAFATLIRSRATQRIYCGVLAASALAFSPMAVPILPVEAFVAYQAAMGAKTNPSERRTLGVLPQTYADMFGWPELVTAVARVYQSLPPEEREHAAVYSGNYGVASAVEILGPALGIPRGVAISGHNQYWFWGVQPGRGSPIIHVTTSAANGCPGFLNEELAAQLPVLPYAMPDETGHRIWICRDPSAPFHGLPPSVRHFD